MCYDVSRDDSPTNEEVTPVRRYRVLYQSRSGAMRIAKVRAASKAEAARVMGPTGHDNRNPIYTAPVCIGEVSR
jgi:hypothetical protein